MLLYSVFSFSVLISGIKGLNLVNENNCPKICTCQLEHLTETAIYRFMQKDKKKQTLKEVNSAEFNDVFYEENLEAELMEEKTIIRSAICILQTETEPLKLIEELSQDTESLTLIQGYDTGSKIVKFSYLNRLSNLLSLELLGPNSLNKQTNSQLISEIDTPLPKIKYLNLENISIKNTKEQIQNFVKEFSDDIQTFEYVQKIDADVHPITIIQKGTNEEIVPYEKYKEQDNEHKVPLFIGFKSLFLLRITHCELNNVHWAMFDGLSNLQFLLLEKNNLKFIPPFAFYGTPNLKTLSLAHNNLLDIQITDLAGLLELEFLDLSFNNFSQLSELSLPPFPKLKLADFGNNPITVIFPNTFEVMNTTDSLIIGSDDVHVSLLPNSFAGLNLLKSLILKNVNIRLLKRDFFIGMPNLDELAMTGNITEIEYDTFLEIHKLKKLILTDCKLQNLSMDAFFGLEQLEILDLSKNQLEYLPPGIFDQLINIKEIYLNGNKFAVLPREVFSKIHAKMVRLNENPWHCSCEMSDWKPVVVNRIKQKIVKPCDYSHDKGISCNSENRFGFKYVYENKVAPKCAKPKQYLNWSVFHVMRKLLKCPEYKPKLRKHLKLSPNATITEEKHMIKLEMLQNKLIKHNVKLESSLNTENDISTNKLPLQLHKNETAISKKQLLKNKIMKKLRKHKKPQINNNILV